MNAKISLIIPIYNAAQYLAECLDSVTAQTMFADVEVLLIDDGSTDASSEICDTYAKSYANIEVIHKENGGVSAARNAGLDRATGKYIAFADADDLLKPEMLGKLYEICEKTGAQMAICGFEHSAPEKHSYITYPFEPETILDRSYIRTKVAEFMLCNDTCNALWNKLFLRSIIKDNGIRMTEGKKYAEDREFVLRFLGVAESICYTPFIGYYYRYVETGAVFKPRLDYIESIIEQYEDDFERFKMLDMDPVTFAEKSGSGLCERVCNTISMVARKMRGKTRRAVLRNIYDNSSLQKLLSVQWQSVTNGQTRYKNFILYTLRRGKVWILCMVIDMLLLKERIYARLKVLRNR